MQTCSWKHLSNLVQAIIYATLQCVQPRGSRISFRCNVLRCFSSVIIHDFQKSYLHTITLFAQLLSLESNWSTWDFYDRSHSIKSFEKFLVRTSCIYRWEAVVVSSVMSTHTILYCADHRAQQVHAEKNKKTKTFRQIYNVNNRHLKCYKNDDAAEIRVRIPGHPFTVLLFFSLTPLNCSEVTGKISTTILLTYVTYSEWQYKKCKKYRNQTEIKKFWNPMGLQFYCFFL